MSVIARIGVFSVKGSGSRISDTYTPVSQPSSKAWISVPNVDLTTCLTLLKFHTKEQLFCYYWELEISCDYPDFLHLASCESLDQYR